jgi:cytochrome c oxidase subunit 2
MRGRLTLANRLLTAAGLLVALVVLAGCTGDPQDTLTADGVVSEKITELFWIVFAIAVVVFVLVEGALVFALIRYRHRRDRAGQLPTQLHGSTPLEITWTIIPTVILAALAIPTISTIRELDAAPEDALEVRVIGHQWWWEFQYPESGVVTADELHIPVGRPVKVTLNSADVIHSFWVPKLAGKTDVVPNHNNTMWFQAKEAGVYSGQCAEFCALSHAKMKFSVVAESQADFDAWLRAEAAPAPTPTTELARQGEQAFFGLPCIGCHTIKGPTVNGLQALGTTGPNLTHFALRDRFAGSWLENNPENLRLWLQNPPAIKPGSLMPNYNLTDEQITQLIAYLESLK